MNQKAKVEELGRYDLSVAGFRCLKCGSRFYIWFGAGGSGCGGFEVPPHCPNCGAEFINGRTPESIVEEIKRTYHSDKDEEKMENLLYELQEIAEKNEK